MLSEIFDQGGVSSLHSERQVGFWKPESIQQLNKGMPYMPFSRSIASSLHEKLSNIAFKDFLEHPQSFQIKDQNSHVGFEWKTPVTNRGVNLSTAPWKSMDLGVETGLSKDDLNKTKYENSLFARSLSEVFKRKLELSPNDELFALSTVASQCEGDESIESFKETETDTIGDLLPDDDDLLSGLIDEFGIPQLSTGEGEEDFDFFSSGGGFELEMDSCLSYSGERKNVDFSGVKTIGQFKEPIIAAAGEHPYGEHPSRTLFVRNINSNVDDDEIRKLFEQFGDIHTLYTACKPRGFVMISYYDIRASYNAIRALQNKPLKQRKLDIHYSIPKDNSSERDINQGTLMVFNLDSSVSNDYLCQIFGTYGDIREIRENPHNQSHKFLDFYDIRAAEAALHALNKRDIAGKHINLEPSHHISARMSPMQQISPDLDQEEVGSVSKGLNYDNGTSNSFQGRGQKHHTQFMDAAFNPINSSDPHGSSCSIHVASNQSFPINTTSVDNYINHLGIEDIKHSGRQMGLNFQHKPTYHPHSLPECQDGSMAFLVNSCLGGSYFDPLDGSKYFGAPVDGNCPLHRHDSVWKNSSSTHHPISLRWPSLPTFTNTLQAHSIPSVHDPHGLSHVPHPMIQLHQVGSAPVIKHPWDGQYLYQGNLTQPSVIHLGSLGNVGFSSGSTLHQLDLISHNILPHGGNYRDPCNNVSFNPSQKRCQVLSGMRPTFPVSSSFDTSNERRCHRNGANNNQVDKKQYELDINHILHGEDTRTTLMIKNIPNKYTSKMLLAAIDEHHRGTYDFIYLPIDFKNKCNVGYAFINMIDPLQIVPFYQTFNGKKWEKFNSEKVASLAYARIQGKAALIAHFQNSSLMNEDKRCRPILFHSDGPNAGDQEPFPVGTNIRCRHGKSRTNSSNYEDSHDSSPPSSVNGETSSTITNSSSNSTKPSISVTDEHSLFLF